MMNPRVHRKALSFYQKKRRQLGEEAATSHVKRVFRLSDQDIETLRNEVEQKILEVKKGGPYIREIDDDWYEGPDATDLRWQSFQRAVESEGKGNLLETIDKESTKIVNLTPAISKGPKKSRGLVVGYVQSGKTMNFTAVAAKMADLGYRMVLVLAGLHNGLRRQTQERLERDLIGEFSDGWYRATGLDSDFDIRYLSAEGNPANTDLVGFINSEAKTTLLVVKKNVTVLKKLRDWLNDGSTEGLRKTLRTLVIDDEADQASVATSSINPLIREILDLLPAAVYVGYTATPFANVFVCPTDESDLYPRDFIYPLPRPKGYFGPAELFGDFDDEDADGLDMIREIPYESQPSLRPMSRRQAKEFEPEMTPELRKAVQWYFLATAARRQRGDYGDSTMLIHTSLNGIVHRRFEPMIESFRQELIEHLQQGDAERIRELETQWLEETSRVGAEQWGRKAEGFDEIEPHVLEVLKDTQVIIDNSDSELRLEELNERVRNGTLSRVTAIVIGGNTLSRGITLNGLVCSFFLRPSNTYDTLLQMGRWFGFRPGYQDLPRIWMTASLMDNFRHLSVVEHEMRRDIARYEEEKKTPMQVATRIRTHPSLKITAKMGAAQPASINYWGARLQNRYLRPYDEEWLRKNLEATKSFIGRCIDNGKYEQYSDRKLHFWRDVPADDVVKYFSEFEIDSNQANMELGSIIEFIQTQTLGLTPQLDYWDVAIAQGYAAKDIWEIGGKSFQIRKSNRAPQENQEEEWRKDPQEVVSIKTLMTPEDYALAPVTTGSARPLVMIYVIDKNSKSRPLDETRGEKTNSKRRDMDASEDLIGLAILFPENQGVEDSTLSVRTEYMAVRLPEAADRDGYREDVDVEGIVQGDE